MVKMRINLGSFGIFGSIWVEENAPGRKMYILNFGVFQVKKFKFGGTENLGNALANWSIFQNVQIFGERSMFMKCIILYGCWSGIKFLIFKIFYMVFRWGQKLGTNLGFQESFPQRPLLYLAKFLASFMCNQVRSFNVLLCWWPGVPTSSSLPIPSHARTHLLKPVHLSFSLLSQQS